MSNLKENIKNAVIGWQIRHTRLFDVRWYREQAGLDEKTDPYEHYLQGGWRKFDSSRLFSGRRYLEANADIAESGVCPLSHYMLTGRLENRKLFADQMPERRWRYEISNTSTDTEKKEIGIAEKWISAEEHQPLVSVIIPTYNRAESITESCESVLTQTYRNLELIIVDDCSTDNTEEIVKSLGDPRVRYFRHEINQGACAARNTGIGLARGEYIAFQDSDDLWLPEKLEIQIASMIGSCSDVCFCGFLHRHGKDHSAYTDSSPGFYREGIQNNLITVYGIGTQTLVFRREVLQENQFDPEMPKFQDLELMMRIARKYRVYYCDQELVLYRTGDDSISQNADRMIAACDLILKKHPDVRREYPLLCRELADVQLKIAEVTEEPGQKAEMNRMAIRFDTSPQARRQRRKSTIGNRDLREKRLEK